MCMKKMEGFYKWSIRFNKLMLRRKKLKKLFGGHYRKSFKKGVYHNFKGLGLNKRGTKDEDVRWFYWGRHKFKGSSTKMDKTNKVGTGIDEKVNILNLMQWNLWIHEHMKKSYSYLFAQFLVPIASFPILLGLIFYVKKL